MMSIMNDEITFGDAVAELDNFDVAIVLAADALVAILAENEGLALFELQDVLAARVLFCQIDPRAIIEDVAILENFHKGRALVCGGALSACPSSVPGKYPRSVPQRWLPRRWPGRQD